MKMKMGPELILFPVLCFVMTPTVVGHGYVKSWASDDQKFQKAQKQPLSDTAFRAAPSNIGWIGSHFIDSPAFVCGASDTPFNKVAPPGGTLFSAADQSAKKTLPVNAGGKISLIIENDPGQGFPHPDGHILAYLGYCGESSTACQDFDASTTSYHRIQAELDGISKKLRKQYNSEQGGDLWTVPIPKDIVDGSYILRIEMIAFGQSSPVEGQQDQYYVFCGQIAVKGGTGSSPIPEDDQPTIKLPGAFKAGNITPKSLPNPLKLVAGAPTKKSENKIKIKSKDTGAVSSDSNDSKDTKDSEDTKDPTDSKDLKDSKESKEKVSSLCGDRCYKKKLTELKDLAPDCSADQFTCLCKSQNFVKAYQSCCNDHCQGLQETQAAVTEIYHKCSSAQGSPGSAEDSKPVDASKSDDGSTSTAADGSKKLDDESAGEKSEVPADHSPKKAIKLPNSDTEADTDSKNPDITSTANSRKLPSACNGVCYKAKITESELHHLAPSCKADDLDCLCRSHKWVCSYAACSNDNCPSAQDAQSATDEIYAICGARLASLNRGGSSLPSTDYIPVSSDPSAATRSKSNKCSQTCRRKISSSSGCPSPDNLKCICKSHADVCAWAKCAEDQCFDEVDAIRLASDQIYDQCSKQ
ncbi:hypothetical protein VP01_2090g1 [Puccinia sorghi]|uniref:lytic cellulose monooxygenase (C4-dehydrogenating) n=1 Tax=Puccinia sorghi TaxID=27349 RepID=A0A0L6VAD6_9BASI|nr:hypothetical protein VP01_2090g1 [Puccinia sorghi]